MDEVRDICERLLRDSHALSVLVMDKNGQTLARAGLESLDFATLSARFATVGAGDIAKLLAIHKEYSGPFHEGERKNIHLSLVAQHAVLAVLFDLTSSLGLVRLRSKKATEELAKLFSRGPSGSPPAAAAAAAPPKSGR